MADSLMRIAETFCNGMLVHLWQTTLVLAVLWMLSRALRNAPASLQATLWWIGVLKLFLPLSLLAPVTTRFLSAVADRFQAGSVSTQVEWISATFWLRPVTLQTSAEAAAPTAGMFCVALLLAWFAGLGWILVRRLPRTGTAGSVPLRSTGHERRQLEAKLRDALKAAGIPTDSVLLVEGIGMPAVRGLLHPRIELPARVADRLAVEDLTAVLLHEQEHRRRRDPLRQVPAVLASWLFFFYPPLRWVLRRVYETTEMACDEAVLRHGIAPRDYARSIARTLKLGLGPARGLPAFIGPGRSSLRRRLARLDGDRRYRTMFTHRIILAVAALIALLGSIVPLTPGTQAGADPVSATAERFVALDRLANVRTEVTLQVQEVSVDKVLDTLARTASFKLKLDPTVRGRSVSISLERGTVRDALVRLAAQAGLHYKVPDSTTLEVRAVLLPGIDGVTSPVRIESSAVKPVYPEEMRKARLEGRVILQAVIDPSGTVRQVELLSSDHSAFSESAIAALEQWRYEPATLEGEPVEVFFTIVIEFDLRNGKKATPEEGGETL